jgi:hypothetical protein
MASKKNEEDSKWSTGMHTQEMKKTQNKTQNGIQGQTHAKNEESSNEKNTRT